MWVWGEEDSPLLAIKRSCGHKHRDGLTRSSGQTRGRRSPGTPFHASLRSCATKQRSVINLRTTSCARTNVHVVSIYAIHKLPPPINTYRILARLLLRRTRGRVRVRLPLAKRATVDDVEGIWRTAHGWVSARTYAGQEYAPFTISCASSRSAAWS